MVVDDLHEIIINSKNYGELNGVSIFLTEELYKSLQDVKTTNGTPLLELFKSGRAVQGLKHLVTAVKHSDSQNKIILCLSKTEKHRNEYRINYTEYKKNAQSIFFSLYKETGENAAKSYLNRFFPETFRYEPTDLRDSDLRKVDKQFPQIIKKLANKHKNKVAILEEAISTLEEMLSQKNKAYNKILKDLQSQSNITYYEQKLQELKFRLTQNYHETRGANSWQRWIYENSWLLGVQYLKPIEKARVGFDNIPDYLFPSLTGFLDILEIKLPSCQILVEDQSHAGSYAWCPDTNKAIGQVANYIQEMELHQLELKERINEIYRDQYGVVIQVLRPSRVLKNELSIEADLAV